MDNLLALLAGGESFTKLDLAHAYQQLVLDEESDKLVKVNTHRGLFKYKRLPFSISAAPTIFQRIMQSLLQGFPKVCVYIDDVLVKGRTEVEYLDNLTEVLRRMDYSGMRLKWDKCPFMLLQVHYLGHTVNSWAIRNTLAPRNIHQLKSLLGLLNFFVKFLKNLFIILAQLYFL